VRVPDGAVGQDTRGRLWDVLWMAHFAIKSARSNGRELLYELAVANDSRGPQPVTLKLGCVSRHAQAISRTRAVTSYAVSRVRDNEWLTANRNGDRMSHAEKAK
jgi:hypothetical protein